MRLAPLISLFAFMALFGWACDSAEGQLRIRLVPLELEGVADACYDLEVTRTTDQARVWKQAPICSNTFGADGSFTYIGTCDATDPARLNTVNLILNDVYADTAHTQPLDFHNPCPGPLGCSQEVPCFENTDSQVLFDLTLILPANQGFFDIAIDLDGIFCSAKFDTCYDGENPCYTYFVSDISDAAVFPFAPPRGLHYDLDPKDIYHQLLYVYNLDGKWMMSHTCFDPGANEGNEVPGPYTGPPNTIVVEEGGYIITLSPTGAVEYFPTAGPDSGQEWITLLSGYDDNANYSPGKTGVLAFACTAGPGQMTHLLMEQPVIHCCHDCGGKKAGEIEILAPTFHPQLPESPFDGAALPTSFINIANTIGIGAFNTYPTIMSQGLVTLNFPWQWAVYSGEEDLECDKESCGKQYWNTAIGLEGLDQSKYDSCTLKAVATATSDMEDFHERYPRTYPYIQWDIPLLDDDIKLRCLKIPLAPAGGVSTQFRDCEDHHCHPYDAYSDPPPLDGGPLKIHSYP